MKETGTYQIQPEDLLLRRIPLRPSHIFQGRITSACFKTKPGEDGLSVDIEVLIADVFETFNRETHTLARLKAQIPLELGYECKHDPVDGNFAHALILGDTNPIAKKLASLCEALDKDMLKKL